MEYFSFIRKIKTYSILAIVFPILALGICLFMYKSIGSTKAYPNYVNWSDKEPYYNWDQSPGSNLNFTFTNCPLFKVDQYYVLKNNQEIINSDENFELLKTEIEKDNVIGILHKKNNSIKNKYCVKNKIILYQIFKYFPSIERLFIRTKLTNISGFSEIKNPFLYGEVSISRTARYFPATLVFKPLIVLSAIFLFFYWKNNLNLFNELKKKQMLDSFSSSFFNFGLLACIFLTLHAIFLGIEIESKLFAKFRRLIIILFIFCEVVAQVLLTKNIFKLKEKLKGIINYFILKIKVLFVLTVLFTTFIAFLYLSLGDPSTSFKHILEWNYFTFLLIFYLLSRLLWK